MSGENGAEMPVFDFSQVNRRWRKRWLETQARGTEIQYGLLEKIPPGEEASKEENVEFGRFSILAIRELQAIGDEQAGLIAQVLESVPQDWLSDDAPDDLDWSDPESQGWLLEERFGDLVQMLNTERQANSKNSPAPTSSPPTIPTRSSGKATTSSESSSPSSSS